jgi:hypothetical protein
MQLDGFGYKNMWFAIKDRDVSEIVQALGLGVVGPCEWSDGIDAAYEFGSHKVFITPRIDGWTMCVGTGLLDLTDGDGFADQTANLAAALRTEVQFFGTHRVVEAHSWARATPEKLVRAYEFVGERGETTTDVGPATTEEEELGFRFFDERSPEAAQDNYWERDDLSFPTEESVMLLAGKWSVDPTGLEGREVEDSVGTLAIGPGGRETLPQEQRAESAKPWWKFW